PCVKVCSEEDGAPVEAVLRRSGQYDLAVVGLSEDWGMESHLFGLGTERIAQHWEGSLLLVRKSQRIIGL
ncbi:MAG: hypothetical protein HY801_12525, partial [Candidatus Lindowbacteria bacterium]|nr:hypothetical protein [Candidatus Lindowbacteria bacterium]